MSVIIMSDDCVVVRIVVGWVVVISLGSYGYWGGEKTYFGVILWGDFFLMIE